VPAARKILVVQSSDQAQLSYGRLTDSLKTELSHRFGQPINYVQFGLDPPGFSAAPEDGAVTYLRSLFAGHGSPDLIVTIGASAAQFILKHGEQLFPGAPALLAGVDDRFLRATPLPVNVAIVPVRHDPSQMIDTILRLRPDTTRLFVVMGASRLEQAWGDVMRRDAARFPQLSFDWATGSFSDVLTHAAALPGHSAILYGLFNLDAQGAAYDEEHVLAELHAVATAPLFGFQSHQLGHGIVGGPLMDLDDVSHHAVDAALRILNGESPSQIKTAVQLAGSPMFDWRELRRWQIDENRLPAGSVVRLREPTPWERSRWVWLTGGAIGLVEGVLIVGLVGVVANGIPVVIMWRAGPGHDLNLRAAMVHAGTDVLGSAGAALAGLLVWTMGWQKADPLIASLIGVLVLVSAWALVRDSLRILLEAAPGHLDPEEIGEALASAPGVREVHDLHVWTITSGFAALSAHVVARADADSDRLLHELEALLQERFGLMHTTIQIDREHDRLLQIDRPGDQVRRTRPVGLDPPPDN